MSGTDVGRGIGEILADTSDWTGPVVIRDLAPQCCAALDPPKRSRVDQPCAILENVLSPADCEAIVHWSQSHHQTEPQGLEPGYRSQFTSTDPLMTELLWAWIYNSCCVGSCCGPGSRIRYPDMWMVVRQRGYLPTSPTANISQVRPRRSSLVLTCRPGQVGFPHMDFRHGHKSDPCICSRISFTIYLNTEFEGGELEFLAGVRADQMGFNPAHLSAPPVAGAAAIFYQGLHEFAHDPLQVRNGCKYIMRADVMYQFDSPELADISQSSN